jgi:hypothetical protein
MNLLINYDGHIIKIHPFCHNVIIGANHATQHFQLLSGGSECF